MQEYISVWLRKADPKFGSTLRRHLAEHGEEEPRFCAIVRRSVINTADQEAVPPSLS